MVTCYEPSKLSRFTSKRTMARLNGLRLSKNTGLAVKRTGRLVGQQVLELLDAQGACGALVTANRLTGLFNLINYYHCQWAQRVRRCRGFSVADLPDDGV